MKPLHGTERLEFVDTLEAWFDAPAESRVQLLYGPSGIGKTTIAEALGARIAASERSVHWCELPDGDHADDDESLLFELATTLADGGAPAMQAAFDHGAEAMRTALVETLRTPRLLVIDEGQGLFDKRGTPHKHFANLLKRIARAPGQGKLLVLTHERPADGKWRKPFVLDEVPPLSEGEGRSLLDALLAEHGAAGAIEPAQRTSIVAGLGAHPRAMTLLVGALRDFDLDELLTITPDLWGDGSAAVAEVDPHLVDLFEREVVARMTQALPAYAALALRRASIFRGPFDKHALKAISQGEPSPHDARFALTHRYLLRDLGNPKRWRVDPVVRLVARARLDAAQRKAAHRCAAEHYARHFEGQRTAGRVDKRAADLREARHHLRALGETERLRRLVAQFGRYALGTISLTTPVPKGADALDARIELLWAVAPEPGQAPMAVAHHLARCLDRRAGPRDAERALAYSRSASRSTFNGQVWRLRLRLECAVDLDAALRCARPALPRFGATQDLVDICSLLARALADAGRLGEAVALLRPHLDHVPPQYSLYSLYQQAGQLLAAAGQHDEAVALLRRGIESVPPQYNLFSLYQQAGLLLAAVGQHDEAVALLRRGIDAVPPQYGLFSLYQQASEVLAAAGQHDEAVALLRRGIDAVPPQYHLVSLYQQAGQLLAAAGEHDEAVALLRRGIEAIPQYQVFLLYQPLGAVLAAAGKRDEALTVLRKGIETASQRSVSPFYQQAGQLLAAAGQHDEAVALLRRGIDAVPPQYSLFSLYQQAGQLLAAAGQHGEAIALLRRGIDAVPPQYSLYSLYYLLSVVEARRVGLAAAIDAARAGLAALPPGRFNRYRLGELAVLLAASSGDPDRLDGLIGAPPPSDLGPPQVEFASLWAEMARGGWANAAQRAVDARGRHPRAPALRGALILARAGSADLDGARAALLDSAPGPGNPEVWLAAMVELAAGAPEVAAEWWALDHPNEARPADLRRALLNAWASPMPLSGGHPAYYFPILPTALTGLAGDIRRQYGQPAPPIADVGAAPAPPAAAPARQWLAVATEWSSHHGGLSTLNRELCLALVGAGEAVACLALDPSPSEIAAAAAAGVVLIGARPGAGDDPKSRLARRPALPDGLTPTHIIGHGRITGPAARVLVDDFFPEAARVHLLHMDADDIGWHKDRAQDPGALIERRRRQELELARGAGVTVAVGPRLHALFAVDLREVALVRLDPPPPGATPVTGPPPGDLKRVLTFGRMEDPGIKRPDLAAKAAAGARGHGHRVQLVARGAQRGTTRETRAALLGHAGDPGLDVSVREFTTDAAALRDDLTSASVVLMPSRAEGFGLVGLEAIAAGVPVRVSDRSGLGELLVERFPEHAARCVVPVTDDAERDAAAWTRAVDLALTERGTAFARAAALRAAMVARLSWSEAVADILDALGSP